MTVYLKRRASFSAAHNYYLPELPAEENRQRFGQWSSQEGHGHNYRVQATVAGDIDETTGMVVNITDVNLAMKRTIIDVLDGKFLNREVEFFKTNSPTVENIGGWIFDSLAPELPQGATLTGVKVWEMDSLLSNLEVDEAQKMTTTITRSYDFSASHRLHSKQLSDQENIEIFGKCNNSNGHGHNYGVDITIIGSPNPVTGMIFPIDDLDSIVEQEILIPFDHKHLNLDVPEFADLNPTSEMLTVVIWRKLARRLPTSGSPRLYSVVVTETARNSFEYRGA